MSFFQELRRRNVIRVAAAYLALAWLVVQIVETLFPMFGVSDAAARIVVVALAIGFIPVLVLSWAFEWTPEGLKRDSAVESGSPTAQASAKRLDRIVIAALAVALTYFVVDELLIETQSASSSHSDRSIAVLPFVNMSSDPEQDYFADGISEELLNLLARIPELRVISRTSAFAFKGKDIDIPEIARALNVTHVLEGSVRKSGNSIRITVQLIQTDSDRHLWSETYERTLDDIFAIQDDVRGTRRRPVGDPAARGRAQDETGRPTCVRKISPGSQYRPGLSNRSQYSAAAKLLEAALAIEPDYVDAMILLRIIVDDPVRQAALTQKVLELDPQNASLKAFAAVGQDDMGMAVALLNEAAETDPTNYMVLFNGARIAQRIGQLELAIEIYEYLVARDPLFFWAHLNLADYYTHADQIEDGLRSYERALELNTQAGNARWKHGLAFLINGEPERARAEFELEPEEEARTHGLALAYHDLGRFDESQVLFDALVEGSAEPWPFGLARAYAWIGDADNTFHFLEESVERNLPLLGGLGRHPLFYKLHDDPRWMPFLESIGQARRTA